MSVLSAFTNQLLNLMGNLCDMYPSDPDLSFTKTSIQLMKKSNPRKLQEIFEEYVAIHEKAIMEKNGDFFIKRDFVKTDFNQVADSDYANKIMENLKKYWSSIDSESKENIWKYLQVLLILNKRCSKTQRPVNSPLVYK